MRSRYNLACYFANRDYTKGAEIGVYRGLYSETLCKVMPDLDLLCVDNWAYGKYKRAEKECRERLKPYRTTLVKLTSVEAAKDVPDGSLDFVYIDADHKYENVMADLEAWTPKVKIGGIVSGDDFYKFPKRGDTGVMQAVSEFTSDNKYNLKLTDWNEDNPIRDDRQPSFYFERTH